MRGENAIPSAARAPRPMLRETLRFLLRLSLAYGALLALWLPFGDACRRALVATGNACFRLVMSSGAVSFHTVSIGTETGAPSRADVAVLVHRPGWVDAQGRRQHVLAKRIATFHQPYSATALLLALFAASRVHRRKAAVHAVLAVLALLVLHLCMAGCVGIDVAHALAAHGGWPGLPAWVSEAISLLHVSITDWPAGVLIVPLLLWLPTCHASLFHRTPFPMRRRAQAECHVIRDTRLGPRS